MKVIIADDHPFTLQGTKAFVTSIDGNFRVVETCTNGITALNLIQTLQPDIVILDINMPGLDGLDVLRKIRELKLNTNVILLTMHKELSIFNKAKEWGADGYLLKEYAQNELALCLQAIVRGEKYFSENLTETLISGGTEDATLLNKLTLTEQKIVKLIAQQMSSKQIAELLFVSEKTIEGHRSNIISKLELPKEKNSLLKWAIANRF
jgi:two-component system nitrate/nitrite response regulator NarL